MGTFRLDPPLPDVGNYAFGIVRTGYIPVQVSEVGICMMVSNQVPRVGGSMTEGTSDVISLDLGAYLEECLHVTGRSDKWQTLITV